MEKLPGGGTSISKLKPNLRAKVVVEFPDKVSEAIVYVRTKILLLSNNIYISNPSPSISKVISDVANLEAKESIALTRVIGSAAERDVALETVKLDVFAWAAQVQYLADLDRDNCIAIIESAGFRVKKIGIRTKYHLKAVKWGAADTVKLVGASLGRRIAYEWQMSTDGQNWTSFFATNVANKIINGLAYGQLYYFRYRGNTSVEGRWCDMIAYIAH